MVQLKLKRSCANCEYHDDTRKFLSDPPRYYCEIKKDTHLLRDTCDEFVWKRQICEAAERRSATYEENTDLVKQLKRIADALEEINERMKWNR